MVRGMSSPTATLEGLTEANRTGDWVQGRTCHTGALLAALPTTAHAAVVQALAMPTSVVKTARITEALIAAGVPVKTENLGRHRRRIQGGSYGCKCPLLSEVPS